MTQAITSPDGPFAHLSLAEAKASFEEVTALRHESAKDGDYEEVEHFNLVLCALAMRVKELDPDDPITKDV